jgi:hypothetical protein
MTHPIVSAEAERLKSLSERIRQYLSVGGYFNPELMDHDKVRDLLIDLRDMCDTAISQDTDRGEK